MPKWRVTVNVLVRRVFEVEADDVNGAIMVAYRSPPKDETDVREDVIGVYEIENEDVAHPRT